MVQVFMAGWSGKSVTQGKIIEVKIRPKKGQSMAEALREFFTEKELHADRYSAYGTAGAVWYMAQSARVGRIPVLVGTWYRDTYGNAYFRNKANYN